MALCQNQTQGLFYPPTKKVIITYFNFTENVENTEDYMLSNIDILNI